MNYTKYKVQCWILETTILNYEKYDVELYNLQCWIVKSTKLNCNKYYKV